jgi:hypothetical protein
MGVQVSTPGPGTPANPKPTVFRPRDLSVPPSFPRLLRKGWEAASSSPPNLPFQMLFDEPVDQGRKLLAGFWKDERLGRRVPIQFEAG